MTFSIVIPTKNRHNELLTLLKSILKQTLIPNQIIIIDQSKNCFLIKKNLLNKITLKKIIYDYLNDESISGLVEAKQRSIKLNKCDYISFFDDDIILQEDYFENIKKVLIKNPSIIGLNGFIINYPKVSFIKKIIFSITHIGIFKDNRIKCQLKKYKGEELIKLNVLSGGLSTWKKEIFKKVNFDVLNKLHAYEDQEFSIRVKIFFSNELYLVSSAKLYHNHSNINRKNFEDKYIRDLKEIFIIYKKNKEMNFSFISIIMLLIGLFINAVFIGIKFKNFNVISGYFLGIKEGLRIKVINE